MPVQRPREPGRAATGASSRTSLWSLLVPVLQAADSLGIIDVSDALLASVADRLDDQAEACRPASESFVNPAKVLALQLAGSVPVVLGDGLVTGVAAARAAAMLARRRALRRCTARCPTTRARSSRPSTARSPRSPTTSSPTPSSTRRAGRACVC